MARPKRKDYPGAWHHVMNRGARKEPIFRDPDHCSMFLEYLGRVVKKFNIEVHAYVLMPNHYHLLIRSVFGNLSDAMKHFIGPYTQDLNYKHAWDGPLFRGRFNNQVVSESEHLTTLITYIHLNPVRARLVTIPEQARWSSYTDYIGLTTKPDWLTTDLLISMFENVENLIAETYGYHSGQLDWPMDFDLRRGEFKTWAPEIPRTPLQRLEWKERQLEDVKYVVRAIAGKSWNDVQKAKKGRGGNPARRFAIWLLSTRSVLTHKEIAEAVGSNANQISLTLRYLHNKKYGEPLAGWMRTADVFFEEYNPRKGPVTDREDRLSELKKWEDEYLSRLEPD